MFSSECQEIGSGMSALGLRKQFFLRSDRRCWATKNCQQIGGLMAISWQFLEPRDCRASFIKTTLRYQRTGELLETLVVVWGEMQCLAKVADFRLRQVVYEEFRRKAPQHSWVSIVGQGF